MRVLAQNYSSGELQLLEVPEPALSSAHVLVRTAASLVSLGTEKSMIDTARKSLLGKALARPDWVKQVIGKIRTEGIAEAYRQSKARLDMPIPLGYSSAGTVIDVGQGVSRFAVGDRVACSGSGCASHADVVCVPEGLCARVPENVPFGGAAYAALGAIALEAVRMAETEIGSNVAVIGLGLLGQLTVQILHASGCHVLGIDISPSKCELARAHGAERVAQIGRDNVAGMAGELGCGRGVDAAIIMAAAQSNEPVELAAELVRERGRVVATGLVGLEIPRKAFYERELQLVVSRAWGPGVHDSAAAGAKQYTFPYPRWTAKENLVEFIAMLAAGRVQIDKLTTHRYPFEKSLEAYDMLLEGRSDAIGVVLEYGQEPADAARSRKIVLGARRAPSVAAGDVGVGFIGAGMFARGTLLPALKKIDGVRLVGVSTAGGVSGSHVAEKFGFEYSTTDYKDLLKDDSIQAVFVLTRHGSHSGFVAEALRAGKAVFVEKPLAVTRGQLDEIMAAYGEADAPYLMVGFNRRFSAAARRAKEFVRSGGASAVVNLRCNAGPIPADSWVNDPEEGGGRIIGEVCHFVDLAQYLTGGIAKQVFAAYASTRDSVAVSMQMDNGAACSITYASNGDKSFPRERVEIFANAGVFVIDDFKCTESVTNGKRRRHKGYSVDRGHGAELSAFFDNLRRGAGAPVPLADYVATTLTTLAIEESLSRARSIAVDSI